MIHRIMTAFHQLHQLYTAMVLGEIHLQLVVSPLLKLEEDANAGGNEHLVLDPRHLCQVSCRASVLSLQPCCVLWWSHCLL